MVLVAASDNTSWVCDPSLESYALEQPEMLRSPDYRHKCHAPFKWAPTVKKNVHSNKDSEVNVIKWIYEKFDSHVTSNCCIQRFI